MTPTTPTLKALCLPFVLAGLVGCAGKQSSPPADAWWLLADLGDDDDDGDEDGDWDDEDEDDDDDDEGDYGPGAVFWGEAALTDGQLEWGAVGFFVATEEDGLVCELEYELAGASQATGCSACTFAYTLEVGELVFSEGDAEACAAQGFADLQGTTVKAGAAGETLWLDRGAGWVEAGFSELDGTDWFFEGTVE